MFFSLSPLHILKTATKRVSNVFEKQNRIEIDTYVKWFHYFMWPDNEATIGVPQLYDVVYSCLIQIYVDWKAEKRERRSDTFLWDRLEKEQVTQSQNRTPNTQSPLEPVIPTIQHTFHRPFVSSPSCDRIVKNRTKPPLFHLLHQSRV